ncbi:MAG TPA: MFS transporter [Xanthobacteraceae bacterium]|nr:MFS transporter [Xanthobacteraceae bacterium]
MADAMEYPENVALSGRVKILLAICACVVLSMSTWFSTAAVVPQLRADWMITDTSAAWLTIAVQIGFVFGAGLIAVTGLADRIMPRRLMAIAAVGAALANLALVGVASVGPAIVLRFLTGLFMAGIYPPALKLVATWYISGRGVAMGAVIGALTFGSAFPHLLNIGHGIPWRSVIVATSFATLAGCIGIALLIRNGPYPFPQVPFERGRICEALTNRVFLLASAGYLGHMWELYAAWSWMLILVRERLGDAVTSEHFAALLTFAIIAAGAPACVAAGYFADRFGRIRTTIALMTASGLSAVAIGLTYFAPFWVFLLVALIWGATIVGDSAQFSAIVTESGNRHFVGTALTMQLGAGFALTAVTIWLVPIAAKVIGWQWTTLCLVPGPALGILAMLRLRRVQGAAQLATN